MRIIRADVKQKGECQCQSCTELFDIYAASELQIEHDGHEDNYILGLNDYYIDEEENIYKNDKFYGVSRKLKKMYEWEEYISMV